MTKTKKKKQTKEDLLSLFPRHKSTIKTAAYLAVTLGFTDDGKKGGVTDPGRRARGGKD